MRPSLPPAVEQFLRAREPMLWINDSWRPREAVRSTLPLSLEDVVGAERTLERLAAPLLRLFPELTSSQGIIESPLYSAAGLQRALMSDAHASGRWFIKADHALPIAGSIKARGGFYEVLLHAEDIAQKAGLFTENADRELIVSPAARALFAQHEISVGSTGNLGLSIGVMAAALGFKAVVHMSADAKAWKKTRLRANGVQVVEHEGDYGAAVAAGRQLAQRSPNAYFVDDENSQYLFLGYSVAALRLRRQLEEANITLDAAHPLFVYLPCGVGGAPGGITFGLRMLMGDHVHCFFAEPVAAPCMLLRLAAGEGGPISVKEVGLDGRTEADGLAVGQASEWVARTVGPLVSGVFTVRDEELFRDLYLLDETESLRIEPSAAAGFGGPRWILGSPQGRRYLAGHGLDDKMDSATHVLWTTGGSLVPGGEYERFRERGKRQVI